MSWVAITLAFILFEHLKNYYFDETSTVRGDSYRMIVECW